MQQDDICKKFGERVKKLREAKNLSLNMLAYENDINKSTLSRIENGLVDPKLSTIHKIAEGLEMPIDELMKF
jgi:transcriptional regulator with XRE-family HTH domain